MIEDYPYWLSRRGLFRAGAIVAAGLSASSVAATTGASAAELPKLWIGAHAPGDADDFATVNQLLGPLRIRRSFNTQQGWPDVFGQSGGAGDPGRWLTFLSTKLPPGEIAAGLRDAAIQNFARSWPAGHYPGWWTMWHEPENDMTGPEFTAMFRRFFSVAKQANPRIRIGYVAMAYHWRPGSPTTARPDDWYPGDAYTDFLGVDAYNVVRPDRHPERWKTLADAPDFQRWYQWARTKGKWMHVVEYGCKPDPADPRHRAATLLANEQWLREQGNFRMYMYWHSSGPNGVWTLDDPASITAWRDIAGRGTIPF